MPDSVAMSDRQRDVVIEFCVVAEGRIVAAFRTQEQAIRAQTTIRRAIGEGRPIPTLMFDGTEAGAGA